MWLAETRTAVVADVHLGYSWAQRRRGELGPLADFQSRDKLLSLCADLEPRQLIFAGDLVHAPRPCAAERAFIEETLTLLSQHAEIVAVRGNHDRAFAREFGHLPLSTTAAWTNGAITVMHGDKLETAAIPAEGTLVLGHLHPCLSLREASGAGRKLPVFLVNEHGILLPAFSPFAGGYDVAAGLPKLLESCFRQTPIHAYATTGKRISHLGPLKATLTHLARSADISPGRFRRASRKF